MENTHSVYGTKLCAYSRPAKYEGALEALKYRESNAVTPFPVTHDWPSSSKCDRMPNSRPLRFQFLKKGA